MKWYVHWQQWRNRWKLGSSSGHHQQTVEYSKKEIPKLNKLKTNRIQKDEVFQKVENTEITSRNTCDPNWGRDKITMYNPDNKKNFLTSNIIETRQRDAATSRIPFKCNGCTITSKIKPHSVTRTGGQFSNLVPEKQNLPKTKKRRSTKWKISHNLCAELKNLRNINELVVMGTNVNFGDTWTVLPLLLKTKIEIYKFNVSS